MPQPSGKIGILYVSLGTPDSPDVGDVRRFLKEFLSDPLVVDFPRLLWLPLLNGIILNTRPKRTSKAYAKIWDNERGESPLRTIARQQADALAKRYESDDIIVDWAFRYGAPNIEDRVDTLLQQGCDKLVVFALYPQYSQTTAGTVFKEAERVLETADIDVIMRVVEPYHNNPAYISALRDTVLTDLDLLPWKPDALLASFHSIPKKYCDNGDPYRDQCEETSYLLDRALKDLPIDFHMSYQSRLGRTEWLSPYSIDKVKELASCGVKNLMMISPCFAQDNLETLEEIDMELRETFLNAGGEKFHYVRCLNAKESHIALLKSLTDEMIADWRA